MHHPIEWLTEWAANEIRSLCFRYFQLVLSGHVHSNDFSHVYDGIDSYVSCSAPQLFSKKSDLLGYSILQIDNELTALNILYRQWAENRFVAGTLFAKNDTGIVQLNHAQVRDIESKVKNDNDSYNRIFRSLENDLEKCLKCYASVPAIWVLPNISDQNEFSSNGKSAVIVTADTLHAPFRNCLILAPRQFGLSSLGNYLSLAAWKSTPGRYAMYIDSKELQSHETAIKKYIEDRLDKLGLSISNLDAVILDEVGPINHRKINNIKKI